MFKAIYDRANKPKLFFVFAVFITLLCSEVVLTTLVPAWKSYFYDMLKDKDLNGFSIGIYWFGGLILSLGLVAGIKEFISRLLALQIRIPMSKLVLKTWVHAKEPATKNFSQPQTESIRLSTENFVIVVREVFISAMVVIGLAVSNLDKPKVLLCAFLYTVAVSISAVFFGKPLRDSNRKWQELEGVYRESLGDIAAGKGDYTAKEKFRQACQGFLRYTNITMCFTLFSSFKGGLMMLLPYFIFSADYFAGTVTFGQFMGTVTTFELLVMNAVVFTTVYPMWTQVRSGHAIVKDFYIKHLHK
jgi:ABC-type uncharacterized transport system fused permease/ATPase subunit